MKIVVTETARDRLVVKLREQSNQSGQDVKKNDIITLWLEKNYGNLRSEYHKIYDDVINITYYNDDGVWVVDYVIDDNLCYLNSDNIGREIMSMFGIDEEEAEYRIADLLMNRYDVPTNEMLWI